MPIIKVVNLKCGGCEQSVKSALAKAGLRNIAVDVARQSVSFDGDEAVAGKILARLGYPAADSPQAKSLTKKAKSYLSCAIGRIKK